MQTAEMPRPSKHPKHYGRAKKSPHKCDSEGCKNKARWQRRKCNTCRALLWDQKNHMHRQWRNLRIHAAGRRIKCTLTLEQFRAIVEGVEYGGWGGDDVTLDRIDPRRGYEWGNVGLKTRSGNSLKAHQDDWSYVAWEREVASGRARELEPICAGDDPF